MVFNSFIATVAMFACWKYLPETLSAQHVHDENVVADIEAQSDTDVESPSWSDESTSGSEEKSLIPTHSQHLMDSADDTADGAIELQEIQSPSPHSGSNGYNLVNVQDDDSTGQATLPINSARRGKGNFEDNMPIPKLKVTTRQVLTQGAVIHILAIYCLISLASIAFDEVSC